MRERFDIADKKAAAIFSRPRSRAILLHLAGAERTLGELSEALCLPLSLLHYHVRRMLAFGLVEIVREAPRAGRALKSYRAVARTFFVPAQLDASGPAEALCCELRAALDRALLSRGEEGILYAWVEGAGPRMQPLGGARRPDGTELWSRLSLTETDARAFDEEMRRLLHRYGERQHARGRPCLAYLALARL